MKKKNSLALKELKNKTILITGAKGMLGLAFSEMLKEYAPSARVFSFGKDELDVTKKSQIVKCFNINPDYIIHCAALVNADYCEDHKDEAYDVIVKGTINLIELAKSCNAKILYPQSFLIYDGQELPINEETLPNPLSIYGKFKLNAENLIKENSSDSLIIRMAGFFGGRGIDKNFVGKIISHIANLINDGVTSLEIGDRVWQPTFTNDLAYNSLVLLANDQKGIYCMSSNGKASFFELTSLIVKTLEISNIIKIKKVSAVEVSRNEKAKRPETAIIENARLISENYDFQRTWQESLIEYLNHPHFKNLFKS